MSSSWQPPVDYRSRPVTVLGGGVLGRRIAACWASAGYNIRVREPNSETGTQCLEYVKENIDSYPSAKTNKGRGYGTVSVHQDLETAVKEAWLVVEAIPERINLKIDTFAELESLAPQDAILATNSSSYRSGEMLEKVSDVTKTRILNTHYMMPPEAMIVELMTDGYTDPAIIAFMKERQKEAGNMPYVARKESTGFIFNRLWAAIKREVMTILADGVSTPEEIDCMWKEMFGKGGNGPCRSMDKIGLDTVDSIERHYIQERGLPSEKTVDFLKKNYLDIGKLGDKSGKGGFYPRVPKLLVLDIGLAAEHNPLAAGKVLEVSGHGKSKVLVEGQRLPDGIDYDLEDKRMFWTCMGTPGVGDGEVFSANLDGTDVRCILSRGSINTPKQIVVEPAAKKLYLSDREGMKVLRCDYDGGNFETLVKTGDSAVDGTKDSYKWCVGIAVSPKRGKFYWTQKGPSKSGQGRIFCADIDGPATEERTDVQLVLDNLPEPIDLEVDDETDSLYWTDRGELPLGNTVNKARLDPVTGMIAADGSVRPYQILHSRFNETIGLKLDKEAACLYVTDLGGAVYRCSLDGKGKKETIFTLEDGAFTGITVL
ncbi:hypothetical protein GGS20DRAFT_594972 [Poronia punctata]|nr:hypothetical protein GGS20DRAFT_594972 [Poronia punctata]